MKETEKEYLVEDFEKVKERISKEDEEGRYYFRDVYFGEGPERKEDRVRLRMKKDLRTDEEMVIVTFKSPDIEDGLQKAEEFETEVKSFDEMMKILKNIAGEPFFDEELEVRVYRYSGCSVELREVKGLFSYVEIEGPEKKIEELEREFGLGGKIMKKGAFDLVCEKRGIK